MQGQGNLFDHFEHIRTPDQVGPGELEQSYKVILALKKAIKESKKSRARIAAEMTDMLYHEDEDREITKTMIDSWTGQAKSKNRFPLEFLSAFVVVTGGYHLFELVCKPAGCIVMKGDAAIATQLGAAQIEKRRADDLIRKIEGDLSEEQMARVLAALQVDQ